MLLGVQILGVLFALFMIYMTFLNQKRKEFNAKEYFFWISSWTLLLIITLFPNILSPFVKGLHLHRTMDLLTILGFLCIIGLLFYNYTKLRKTNNKVERIIRKIAIKNESKIK